MHLLWWLLAFTLGLAGIVYLTIFRRLRHDEVHDGTVEHTWTVDEHAFYHRVWRSTYAIFGAEPPCRFSICPYFWRIVLWSWLVFWPLGVLFHVIRILGWIIKQPFRLLWWLWRLAFPRRPYSIESMDRRPFRPPFRQRHPTVAKLGSGIGVTLYLLAVLFAVITFVIAIIQKPALLLVMVCVAFGLAIIVFVAIGIRLAFQSQTAHLFGSFLKAKKLKICPYVTVKR